MDQELNINEEDIFNYVFSLETLELDKRLFIENNIEKFLNEIEFCRKINKLEKTDLSQKELESLEIALKSKDYRITLFPQKIDLPEQEYKLAAASITLENKIESTTFTDKNSKFMIRIINYANHSEIFVFPSETQPINKYKLTLLPSKIELFGDSETNGIKTDHLTEIDQINLELLES